MVQLTRNVNLENFGTPYIIAELGSNHNGDMEIAKKMILEAKEAGVDCVKFQSWSKSTIFSKVKYEDNYFLQDDYRKRNDTTLEEIVEAYSISEEELIEMSNYANDIGIDCTSTPFSNNEVDFLVNEIDTPFIKVASMDLNNFPFLEYIAKKNKPIVLSTGLSTLDEVDQAVQVIENAGNMKIVILHCIAIYPPKDNQINLNNIDTYRQQYPKYPIGFSDHTLGTCIPCAAVAKGACLIEKHFTLDKSMIGWDHGISAEPSELKELVINVNRIQVALGTSRIKRVEDEERLREFRRSIVASRDIKKNEVFSKNMLDFKRPGYGLPPADVEIILGKKARRDISYDEIINADDF